MITNIKITLDNGQKYKLRNRETGNDMIQKAMTVCLR